LDRFRPCRPPRRDKREPIRTPVSPMGIQETPVARGRRLRHNGDQAMKLWRSIPLLTLVALAPAACSVALQAGSDFTHDADISSYRTFAWGEADALPTGDPRLDNNPFFQERVRGAVEKEMATRGFVLDPDAPDLLIHYHASVRDRVDVFETDSQYGYDSSAYGAGTQVVQYEEGTLLVDIAEAESMRVIWRGWAQRDIEAALADRDEMDRQIGEAVTQMFLEFPASTGGS